MKGHTSEFVPDQIIPYRDSRFYQTVNLRVHDNGTMIYSELIVPGRVADWRIISIRYLLYEGFGKESEGYAKVH